MHREQKSLRIAQTWRTSPLGLYVASFLFAFQDSAAMLALPWRIMNLGGQTVAIGLVGALSLSLYMVSCFLIGSATDRIGVKRAVLFGLVLTCASLLLIPLIPSLVILFVLIACKGIVMSAFWPPIMGWISTGADGGGLNKRISIFNFSWAAGSIIGCYLGGTLFKITQWLPFVTAAGATSLAFMAIANVQARPKTHHADPANSDQPPEPLRLIMFRWIWRVGFLAAWIALGALRFPIAALIKDMNRGPDVHAILSAAMNIVFMCGFFLLGRSLLWHYKFRFVLLAEAILIATLVGVGLSRTPTELMICVLIGTPAFAFAYFSHLFYAVTGSHHRQSGAATHEIILSVGISIGSFGGGSLGQWCGIRQVYFASAAVIAAAILVQAVILYLARLGWFGRKQMPDTQSVAASA